MSSLSAPFHKDQKAAARPIWLEALAGLDWLALRASPVFYGLGAPRGDGSAVIVVPGFMGTDLYLQEMRWWLRRIGYRGYLSGIGRNADCLDLLVDRLVDTIQKAHAETGRKAHLIGHSLGGVLALSAAALRPDVVDTVFTLGSPFRGIRSHPMVLEMGKLVRDRIARAHDESRPACYTGYCDCDAVSALHTQCVVRHIAVYTKSDGIVDWNFCINDEPATNFEVKGTHVGLAFNADVYRLIADRLAHKEG